MKNSFYALPCLIFLFIPLGNLTAQQVTFGIVTDVHYAEIPDNGTRMYNQSLSKLKEFTDTMNCYKPDFVIEIGDFKDMSQPPDSQQSIAFLQKAENTFARFKGRRYHVLGNHDEDCITKEQFDRVIRNSRIPKNCNYYSFNSDGFHFVVLDANYDSTGKTYSKGNFSWWDSNIPENELAWLRNDLKTTINPVIVFVHQLLDDHRKETVRNAAQVRQVMEASGKVKMVFQGHDHAGGYSRIKGIHYYTLRGLIEGNYPESNSYALVTATTSRISIKGFRRAIPLQLPISTSIIPGDCHPESEYDKEP